MCFPSMNQMILHQGKEPGSRMWGTTLTYSSADAGYQRREEEGGANLVNPIRMVSPFLAET